MTDLILSLPSCSSSCRVFQWYLPAWQRLWRRARRCLLEGGWRHGPQPQCGDGKTGVWSNPPCRPSHVHGMAWHGDKKAPVTRVNRVDHGTAKHESRVPSLAMHTWLLKGNNRLPLRAYHYLASPSLMRANAEATTASGKPPKVKFVRW